LYAAAGAIPSVRKGTPYPAEEAYLFSLYHGPTTADVLKYPQEEASLTTMELATQNLERLLCPTNPMTPEAVAAINRLQRLHSIRKSNTWGPDLIFKAFNDLDLALFNGKLRGHIQLRWKTEEEFTRDYPGRDDSWAMTQLRYRIRDHADKEYFSYGADINLRSARIFQGPLRENTTRWDEMFGTLIHEMTHAYLRFMTRYSSSREHLWCDADRCHGYGHGEHFRRCLRATDHRAAKVGLKGLLDSLNANILESNDCTASVDSSIYDEGEYMNEEALNEAKAIGEAWRIGDMDEAESNQEVLDGMKEFMKMCPGG
ncbi:MAG: hypothetical protein Q9187_009724, partial [Circinaria calcarea]